MDRDNFTCPKCDGEMTEGFVADQGYGSVGVSDWVEGEPVKSFWTGTKISGKNKYQIKSFRCVKCGYLESYAVD